MQFAFWVSDKQASQFDSHYIQSVHRQLYNFHAMSHVTKAHVFMGSLQDR